MKCHHCIGFILLAGLAGLVSGCSLRNTAPEPFHYYTLSYDEPRMAVSPRLPVTLRVDRFTASPPFNSQRIYYSDNVRYRNSYARHEWIASPEVLLPYLLARDLRAANAFQAVLPPDAALGATHALSGWLEEMLEIDSVEPPAASLRLHITLVSVREADPSKQILLQKSYHRREPCAAAAPAALAEAMSRVVAAVSSDIVKDVHRCLSQTRTP